MPSLSGSNNINVKVSTTADTSGITETEKAIDKLDETQNKNSKSTVNWSSEFTKAGAVMAGIGATIGIVAKNALDQAASYQQSRISFETMLGSADKAKTLLMQVSDFAAKTPFELPQVVEGAKNLLAFGVSQEKVISTFQTLGNIAAGVGSEKLPNLITVFGQVKAAGRMMTQDMLQFTSAGVPMIDLLSEHFGIAKDKVKDYVEQGKVSFDDLNASLELLGGPAGRWGDLMAKQSTTFNGTMSNLSDNLGRVLRQAMGIGPDGDIRKGSLFDAATRGANALMAGVAKLQPQMDKLIGFFEHNKAAVYALAGLLAGLVIGPIIAVVVAIGWIPIAIVAAAALISAVIGVIIAKWQEWKTWIMLIGAIIAAPVLPFIAAAIIIIKYWDDIKNFAIMALDFIMQKVFWLKDNWLYALGFIIGFFATLPIKLPIYIYDAFNTIISWIMSINWGGVFAGIGNAIWNAANAIWNAIKWAFDRITSLNWGQILVNIGSGIGNAIIDLVNGAIKGAFSGVPVLKDHVPRIPHFANGVNNFAGGLALVGEQGPEMVVLPRGSSVKTNRQTQQMAANTTNNSSVTIGTLVLPGITDKASFFDALNQDSLLASRGMTPRQGYA